MRIIWVIAAAATLGACASSSEVIPSGKDSYMVIGSANGGMMAGHSMLEATKTANAYCAKLQKVMIIRHTETGGNAGFGGEHSNLIFSCVSEDDPEYKRPNLRKDNGVTTVEQR
jgi:hypothetical protein